MSELGPLAARQPARASAEPAAAPRLVGTIWLLLVINVLGSLPGVNMLLPIPRPLVQMITMGSLLVALGLALVLNPRVRIRPSVYLLLLSLLAVVSVVSSIRLESGFGALFRCLRLVEFVATMWLLSRWWRGDLRFALYHIRALGVVLLTALAGLVIAPGKALSGPGGRLVGIIWPIPSTQIGLYCATITGLCVVLWIARETDGRSVIIITLPAVGMLLLSHTRTALLALLVGLLAASGTMASGNARARRVLAAGIGFGGVIFVLFGQTIQTWLARGQDAEALANLTGRQEVWDLLLMRKRTLSEQFLGVGLTDKSFGGRAIDSSWLSIYYEQGWVGVILVAGFVAGLAATAVLRPPSPARACAVFLIIYCVVASYTEVGLGDASPYLLNLVVAASLLAGTPAATERPGVAARDGVTPA